MKNLYKAAYKKWDQYRAFHSRGGDPFVDFESGHVSLDSNRYSPASIHVRKTYPAREVAIVDTTGRGYSGRIVYKDPATGAVVPVAQLSYKGIATFLIDLKTGRAYSTKGGHTRVGTDSEPYNFYTATIVMDPDGTVRPTQDVTYYLPRKLSPEDKETLLQLVTMCKLVNGGNKPRYWLHKASIGDLAAGAGEVYNSLTTDERILIAADKYEVARLPVPVPYLDVEVK